MLRGHEPSCLQPKLIFTSPLLSDSILVISESSLPETNFQVPRILSRGSAAPPFGEVCATARAPMRDKHNQPATNNARHILPSLLLEELRNTGEEASACNGAKLSQKAQSAILTTRLRGPVSLAECPTCRFYTWVF